MARDNATMGTKESQRENRGAIGRTDIGRELRVVSQTWGSGGSSLKGPVLRASDEWAQTAKERGRWPAGQTTDLRPGRLDEEIAER